MRRVKNKKPLGHKIYFTLLLLIFLFGCATPEKYDAELAGWVGKSENKLIAEWGKPSARKINADGSQVLTYTKADNMFLPSSICTILILCRETFPYMPRLTATTLLRLTAKIWATIPNIPVRRRFWYRTMSSPAGNGSVMTALPDNLLQV